MDPTIPVSSWVLPKMERQGDRLVSATAASVRVRLRERGVAGRPATRGAAGAVLSVLSNGRSGASLTTDSVDRHPRTVPKETASV